MGRTFVETGAMKNDKRRVFDDALRSAAIVVCEDGHFKEELEGFGAEALHAGLASYTTRSEWRSL